MCVCVCVRACVHVCMYVCMYVNMQETKYVLNVNKEYMRRMRDPPTNTKTD